MRYRLLHGIAGGLMMGAVGCADSVVTAPDVPQELSASPAISPPWATIDIGETGPGSTYGIYVPTSWNGDVVYYAHGIRNVEDPVNLPEGVNVTGLRDALGAKGYAFAYSSFSENGYVVKDGIQRTHQLRGLFTARAGQARRSYLAGHSMGGLIVQALAEQHPSQYAGVLPMCGVVGGTKREVDYIANVRVLFEYFYPNAIPGGLTDTPEGFTDAQLQQMVVGAILANPSGAFRMSAIHPLPAPTFPALIQSIVTGVIFAYRGMPDFTSRVHGKMVFDNSETVYTGALPAADLAALNAGVARYTSSPSAQNWLEKYYEPTGALELPTITLHTLFDPVVPFFHETVFAQTVAGAGRRDLLQQRMIPRYGHCAFTVNEMTSAFDALVAWVEARAE